MIAIALYYESRIWEDSPAIPTPDPYPEQREEWDVYAESVGEDEIAKAPENPGYYHRAENFIGLITVGENVSGWILETLWDVTCTDAPDETLGQVVRNLVENAYKLGLERGSKKVLPLPPTT